MATEEVMDPGRLAAARAESANISIRPSPVRSTSKSISASGCQAFTESSAPNRPARYGSPLLRNGVDGERCAWIAVLEPQSLDVAEIGAPRSSTWIPPVMPAPSQRQVAAVDG